MYEDSSEDELQELVDAARSHRRDVDAVFGQMHVPNQIPSKKRVKYLVLSSLLIAYGIFGVAIDDLYLPSKRGAGIHFHGTSVLIFFSAMLVAAANMMSIVLDHYDKRPNERNYRRFAFWSEVVAWALAIVAVIYPIY